MARGMDGTARGPGCHTPAKGHLKGLALYQRHDDCAEQAIGSADIVGDFDRWSLRVPTLLAIVANCAERTQADRHLAVAPAVQFEAGLVRFFNSAYQPVQ